MHYLECLQALTQLDSSPDLVKDVFDYLGSISEVALSPIVASSILGTHKVIRIEELTHLGASLHRAEHPRLEVYQH